MSEEHPHPLLQQLPLTVSPYLQLPTATPLPYTYQSLPSTLPPSVTTVPAPINDTSSDKQHSQHASKPAYVVSANTAHSAHPDAIIESCRALRAHLDKLQADAEATIRQWDGQIRERDLAEKRRVAPGWLDVGEEGRMLVPEPAPSAHNQHNALRNERTVSVTEAPANAASAQRQAMDVDDESEALDRAFGGMTMRS